LARAAWGGFTRAAEAIAAGSFLAFDGAAPGGPLNAFFTSDTARRRR
jgi:hypothetical protein